MAEATPGGPRKRRRIDVPQHIYTPRFTKRMFVAVFGKFLYPT